jgi:ADP-ribose 1''-phosphate phosphatase
MPTTKSTEPISSDVTDNDSLPKLQVKGKSKRLMSTSPPAPANKRLNMESSTSAIQKQHRAYNYLPSDWLDDLTPTKESDDASTKTLQLTYHTGDMFDSAPPNCLLIHACNTQGHWGAGIAKTFKTLYPKAYLAHHKFCAKEHDKTNPVPTGTAQLLAPVDGDTQQKTSRMRL